MRARGALSLLVDAERVSAAGRLLLQLAIVGAALLGAPRAALRRAAGLHNVALSDANAPFDAVVASLDAHEAHGAA